MTLDSIDIHLASQNLMGAGFTIALLANAWRRNWAYALALLLALYETYHRYRFDLHNWVREQLVGEHAAIGAKEILQSKLIYVGGMTLCVMLVLLIPYLVRANAGGRLMVAGAFAAVSMLGLELVSPHHIDAIIFQTVGIFALSAIVYFLSAMLIACGAMLNRKQTSTAGIE